MSAPDDAPRTGVLPSGALSIELDDDALLARHAALGSRDYVMGLEATIVTLRRDLATSKKRVRRLRDALEDRTEEVAALRSSRAFRVGRLLTAPGRRLRG